VGNALPTLASLSDRFGGGSVMVWGGISHGLKSVNVMIGEKILTNSGYMGPGVILLEN
jgi:hypothetical protein